MPLSDGRAQQGWIHSDQVPRIPPQELEGAEADAFLEWLFSGLARRPRPLSLWKGIAVARYLKLLAWEASALARNDPTLLAKSDPPPRPPGWCFAAGQERIFAAGQMLCGLALPPLAVDRVAGTRSFLPQPEPLTRLRHGGRKITPHAFGVDDVAGSTSCPAANRVLRVGQSK